MGFRLVPKSVTLNDLERRNGRIVCVIWPNSVALGPYYVEWLKIHGYILRVKCSPKNLFLAELLVVVSTGVDQFLEYLAHGRPVLTE